MNGERFVAHMIGITWGLAILALLKYIFFG